MTGERRYTSNIQKGGALIQETRRLLLEWSPGEEFEHFVERVTSRNLLGKESRRRVNDILNRIFKRRFDENKTPGALPARRIVEAELPSDVIDRVFYYHAALADDLLYDFVSQYLSQKQAEGRYRISIDETEGFLMNLQRGGHMDHAWAPAIRTRVARGLLAACRDYHLLEGRVTKSFAPVSVPLEVFIYVAYYLKGKVASAGRIIEHPDWRLFLLDSTNVEKMFLEAHQERLLKYNSAGRVVRVDWRYLNLMEAVNALAERAHSHA